MRLNIAPSRRRNQSLTATSPTKEVIKHVSSRAPLLSFTAKLLNKLVGERDWAAQEVSHILLNLPLVSSSRDVVTLDCRPESSQQDAIEIGDEGVKTGGRTAYVRYKDRMQDIHRKVDNFQTEKSDRDDQDDDLDRHREEDPDEREERHKDRKRREQQERDLLTCQETLSTSTLLEWLKYWDHQKFKIRPRAKPRIIHYYPRYKPDQDGDKYEEPS